MLIPIGRVMPMRAEPRDVGGLDVARHEPAKLIVPLTRALGHFAEPLAIVPLADETGPILHGDRRIRDRNLLIPIGGGDDVETVAAADVDALAVTGDGVFLSIVDRA